MDKKVYWRDGGFASIPPPAPDPIRTLIFSLNPRYNGRRITLEHLGFQTFGGAGNQAFTYELLCDETTLESGVIVLNDGAPKYIDLPLYKINFNQEITLYAYHNIPATTIDLTSSIEGQIDF